jgi:hypothetical protein
MKALSKNGKITIYQSVPDSFSSSIGEVLGGGKNMTDEELLAHGLYDCNHPDGYDDRIHNLSASPKFDSVNQVYNYTKTNKTWTETLAELKTRQINHLKSIANSKLQETDWYIIRNAELGTEIPSDITSARADIKSSVDTKESEINALTKKSDVVIYDINIS